MATPETYVQIARAALLSPCKGFRYRLSRRWGDGPCLLYVMLNPSTADADEDDATIRRCIRFAIDHGYHAIEVVNLFAYRATDPRVLRANGYQVGPDNDRHIQEALAGAGAVCAAWGDRARGLTRATEVISMIERAGRVIQCLEVTKHGLPSHPLMLAATKRMRPYAHQP